MPGALMESPNTGRKSFRSRFWSSKTKTEPRILTTTPVKASTRLTKQRLGERTPPDDARPSGSSKVRYGVALPPIHAPTSAIPRHERLTKAPPKMYSVETLAAQRMHRHLIDKDTGERKDVTDLLHSLTYEDTSHDTREAARHIDEFDPTRPLGNDLMAKLSRGMWAAIAYYLDPCESASLALSSKCLLKRIGRGPFTALDQSQNKHHRDRFLLQMDGKLPYHLYCFPCSRYHMRTRPGKEAPRPPNVLNPLFDCPNATNVLLPPPRTRLTPGRNLPFTFVQLATRAARHTPEHGIPVSTLGRRWKDPESGWSHVARYHINPSNNHLLVRVTSQTPVSPGLAPAAQRMLLYSRHDYTPYFSICSHWRDGVLMSNAKCAVSHIPVPRTDDYHTKIRPDRPSGLISLCGNCKPMRRCPECPTEYLIELKLLEDKSVPITDYARFKQALVVTRWSDLGNGMTPTGREWAAVNGIDGQAADGEAGDDTSTAKYDSFEEIGGRAVSGIFEAAFTDSIPGQRILSLNPKGKHKGEEGNDWY